MTRITVTLVMSNDRDESVLGEKVMLRTFFIAFVAAAGALTSSLATAAGSEGLKRPLRTVADPTARVTQSLVTASNDDNSANHTSAM